MRKISFLAALWLTGTIVCFSRNPLEIGGAVEILVGASSYSQGARRIGTSEINPSRNGDIILVEAMVPIPEDLVGKQPLYFMFDSDVKETPIGESHDFRFRCFD